MSARSSLFTQRTWCDRCGKRELWCYCVLVEVSRRTHSSPAEHEAWCRRCVSREDVSDDPHERAAARARANDFAATGGKDWT